MSLDRVKVLVIDDDEDDYIMIRDLFAEIPGGRFQPEWVGSYDAALEALDRKSHAVYLVDYRLGAHTGIDFLREAMDRGVRAPIILLTGYGDEDVDRQAMEIGAADYLVKGRITHHLLERSIRYSIYRAQREDNVRSLFDATFEGIVVHEAEGRILEANRSAAALFGRDPQEMADADFFSFFMEESRSAVRELLGSADARASELIGLKADGGQVVLEVVGKPYLYRGRNARLTAIRDITGRKDMEAQILLQDRLASVGLLASSLAHEIGTPLGVIRGRAEYLAIQVNESPAIKKNVDVIVSQIDRVSKLIRSLLNLARGDQKGGIGAVALSTAVTDVLDLMGHEFRKNGIRVEENLSAQAPIMVCAESETLHQVLLNLFVNSVHAIESAVKAGRGEGHFLRVAAREVAGQWVLSVEDSGCGISVANMRNLFKPFFTTKDIGVGTGLGLATSYRIVQTWGGSIQGESQEGRGTIFHVTLAKA